MATEIRVGVCGFPEAKDRVFRDFGIVEVQQTFYHPPQETTAKRWRQSAPEGFFFTLKAWQRITHEATSPTYRRSKSPLPDRHKKLVGSFKWNELTREAWQLTLIVAQALKAKAIVLQTPASFLPSEENLKRLYYFLTHIDRSGMLLVFEPRGEAWRDNIVARVIQELNLIHGVDPFIRDSQGGCVNYFRLHGRPAYHYRYRYGEGDFHELVKKLATGKANWVLFNNTHMADDARRFLSFLNDYPLT